MSVQLAQAPALAADAVVPDRLRPWRTAALALGLAFLVIIAGGVPGVFYFPLRHALHISLVAMFALWLLWWLLARRRFDVRLSPLIGIPIALLLIANGLSTVLAQTPRVSVESLLWAPIYLVFLLFILELRANSWPDRLWISTSLVLGALSALLAVGGYLAWYRGWISLAGWSEWRPPSTLRMAATFGHPNILAAYLNLLLPLALLAWNAASGRLGRTILTLWFALTLAALYLTSSRGGWVATAITLAVTLALFTRVQARHTQVEDRLRAFFAGRRRASAALGTLVAVLALAAFLGGARLLWAQLDSPSHEGSDEAHVAYWQAALSAIGGHPLAGTGPGTFGGDFLIYSRETPPQQPMPHAHNSFLNAFAELGLLGMVSIASIAVGMILYFWRAWKRADAGVRLRLAACAGGLTGLLVHSQVDHFLIWPAVVLQALILLALALPGGLPFGGRRWPGVAIPACALVAAALLLWTDRPYEDLDRGVAMTSSENWAVAGPAFDQALRADPALPVYAVQRARWLAQMAWERQDQGLAAEGIALYQQVAPIAAPYSLNLANQAALQWQVGRQQDAIATMTRAHAKAPRDEVVSLNLGLWCEQLNQLDCARSAYVSYLGAFLDRSEDAFWQETEFRRNLVKRFLPAGAGYYGLTYQGWHALDAGDTQTATQRFQGALAQDRYGPSALAGLTAVLVEQGDMLAAGHNLALSPYIADANWGLIQARVDQKQGRLALALAGYQDALQRPEEVDAYGRAVYQRASLAGIVAPQLAEPGWTSYRVRLGLELGILLEQAGRKPEAQSWYRQLSAWTGGNGQVAARMAALGR